LSWRCASSSTNSCGQQSRARGQDLPELGKTSARARSSALAGAPLARSAVGQRVPSRALGQPVRADDPTDLRGAGEQLAADVARSS
jgi:hypothetical protein